MKLPDSTSTIRLVTDSARTSVGIGPSLGETAPWSDSRSGPVHAFCLTTMLEVATALGNDKRSGLALPAPVITWAASENQKDLYSVNLLNELRSFSDYLYEPGFNNGISRIVEREIRFNPEDFLSFLDDSLRSSMRRISEDMRVELLSSASQFANPGISSQLTHLARSLLAYQPDSILDTAALALSTDYLGDRGAIPLLRGAASRTKKTFLKRQLQRTADELEASGNEATAEAQ